jgi:hypothetical protein
MKGENMKVKYFLIALMLVAVIIAAGCVGGNKETNSNPTTVTPTTTSTPNSLSKISTPEVTQPAYISMAGSVYYRANNPSGVDDITFSIAPRQSEIDLTKMKIVFSTAGRSPITLTQGATASTSSFTTKYNGAPINLMTAEKRVIDINFKVSPLPSIQTYTVEIIPDIGSSISFSKTPSG